jgi:hypothetical protein
LPSACLLSCVSWPALFAAFRIRNLVWPQRLPFM